MWTHPPAKLDLQPHQVDIWRVSLDPSPDSVKRMESTLSADEIERASRFHFQKDRDNFIAAHGSLRQIIARYLHCEPYQLRFSTNEYGKPFLTRSNEFSRLANSATKVANELEFNLSHSGNCALIAVTLEHKVGIDVERIREDKELESIAKRYFSQSEVSELMALSSEQRALGFFHCWTRKEAYIKAHGLGLSLPLDSFDVSLAPNKPTILRATRPDPKEAIRWTLLSLDVHSDYAGALVVEGNDLEFRYWDGNALIFNGDGRNSEGVV